MAEREILSEWLRRRGVSVLHSAAGSWASAGLGTYQAIPFHTVRTPDEAETEQFLREQHLTALRFSTPVEAPLGSLSYHVVLERRPYSQLDLSKKARHDVKKGLSMAVIEPISFARLAEEGWDLRQETLLRQGRSQAESQSWWQKLCLSAAGLEGFEAWGATVNGRLAAALLSFLCEDCYCILYQQSRSDSLRFGVNNALTYVVAAEVLLQPGVRSIFYGLHSLDAPASVDEYKFRMGFTPRPVRQRILLAPLLRPWVNPLSHNLLQLAQKCLPHNPTLSKAEGVFRFYLNGRLPAERQSLPAVLAASTSNPPEAD
jgi:hypothetical protein